MGTLTQYERIVCNISVCQCCMLAHANGECCPDDNHGGDGIAPWADMAEGHTVTMGLLAEEHNEYCEVYKTGSWPTDYECDCEGPWFGTSRCDGCGSYLHGDRYAFTLWATRFVSGRSEVIEHLPTREGNGTSYTWRRTINGRPYAFNYVAMPNGERRMFVSRYNGYCANPDGTPGRGALAFGCAWSPVRWMQWREGQPMVGMSAVPYGN